MRKMLLSWLGLWGFSRQTRRELNTLRARLAALEAQLQELRRAGLGAAELLED